MTIKELYHDFVCSLGTVYEMREAGNIADWVFESSAGLTHLDRLTKKDETPGHEIVSKLNHQLEQLLDQKPVQYVLGEVFFYKMKLSLNEHVLIPRPETEDLVDWAIADLNKEKINAAELLDIGTGSGCIPIAIKKNLPGTKITAIDVSADALDLARHNARTQNTTIDFLQMDFLNEKEWSRLKYFDLIISNPPYIPQNEMKTLAKNVTDFEPHLALFVPDNDPFLFYKKIATFSLTHLKKEANVFVEVHELFAREVADIFEKNNLSEVTIKKDIYGNERIIKARLINH